MSDTIEWGEAFDKHSQENQRREAEQAKHKKEYEEHLQLANDELWDALGTESFRSSDFTQICDDYGVEPDDLLDMII